ncbi:MAG TPA: site-specific integrase [Solirubrobacteraceae bacterium]|nr:site-specific integrase [Solirubrobacteraceae bacterium]
MTSYALRFRAYGRRHFVHLGYAPTWTRKRAGEELANVMADVRRGTWRSAQQAPEPEPAAEPPTFHEFASKWLADRERDGLKPRTLEYHRWTLEYHLLPHFADVRVDRISVELVDDYARAKASQRANAQRRIAALEADLAARRQAGRATNGVEAKLKVALRSRGLSNGSVNKTLATLSAVLELAVEYGHAPSNPAKSRRRRLPTSKPERLFLEPEQVEALLIAAGQLDAEDRARRRYRRPLLATLAFAGLRVGELLALRWRDVDLASGKIHVRESKTEAGVRTVDLQPELRDELAMWKVTTRSGAQGALVFPTSTGQPDNRNNVRRRVLVRAVERANARIGDEGGCEPLPAGLSPHGLRRTFASWLVAEGEDPAYVMQQLGHTDATMTLGLYAKALKSKRRRPHARRDHGSPEWASMGTNGAAVAPEAEVRSAASRTEAL